MREAVLRLSLACEKCHGKRLKASLIVQKLNGIYELTQLCLIGASRQINMLNRHRADGCFATRVT